MTSNIPPSRRNLPYFEVQRQYQQYFLHIVKEKEHFTLLDKTRFCVQRAQTVINDHRSTKPNFGHRLSLVIEVNGLLESGDGGGRLHKGTAFILVLCITYVLLARCRGCYSDSGY